MSPDDPKTVSLHYDAKWHDASLLAMERERDELAEVNADLRVTLRECRWALIAMNGIVAIASIVGYTFGGSPGLLVGAFISGFALVLNARLMRKEGRS